ncbi:hypothetical protein CONPUDRAFT_158865 [Coniophora puteana RWD-64-598 SS2]|uniref:Uncharacterized protein n=1 Tax=Coniophora puteana (strain RWD-64-598) TaxID=741705 RepID=A0A5M3M7Z7_CONPW|nr:uncharacterized protein CONPUDRAFT_158865 [Coniophora puteana RWD-64-598 SS2]EIW75402.1 hypothetical protein CONPUDRAFT_158865 [Coniophora puteana RWD-64-598 SS2]
MPAPDIPKLAPLEQPTRSVVSVDTRDPAENTIIVDLSKGNSQLVSLTEAHKRNGDILLKIIDTRRTRRHARVLAPFPMSRRTSTPMPAHLVRFIRQVSLEVTDCPFRRSKRIARQGPIDYPE